MTDTEQHYLNNTASYPYLEQLSMMNRQIFMITNKDMKVEFISKYTIDFLELEFDMSEIPSPLPYKLILHHLAKHGYFGNVNAKDIVKTLTSQNKAQLCANPFTCQELDMITPSGRHIHVKQMLTNEGNLLLVGDDVTEEYIQKHALSQALDSSQSGYGIFNIETAKFTLCGDAIRMQFADQIIEDVTIESVLNRIHKDDVEKCRNAWTLGLSQQKPWDITFRLVNEKNRPIWMKSNFTPHHTKDGMLNHIICFFTNVTDTIRVQNELRQVTENTQNTLKAKNDFIGRLSHEIRTPMNAVIGIADALIHHHKDPVILPKLELIQISAEKIIHILDETLQHAKLEEHKVELNPRMASPRKCVETLCQLWQEKAVNNDVTLNYKIDPNVPQKINFDDFRYEQCLNNLLSNAIKFSSGGQISVIQTLIEKDKQSYIVTAVKDNGIGMNAAQQANLFEAFTQADRSISGRFGGTGLGMNITKNIIELMGGRISVKSELGKGSIFALSLPIKSQEDIKTSETSKDMQRNLVNVILESGRDKPNLYENLKILVVDDNPTNHLIVKSLLESLVGEFVTANNGSEAIQVLGTQAIDLVFMDIHMPVMDGIEATLAIRGSDEAFSNVPIIALTADPQYQQKRLCKNIGMDEALAKPVKLTALLCAIDEVMQSRDNLVLTAA